MLENINRLLESDRRDTADSNGQEQFKSISCIAKNYDKKEIIIIKDIEKNKEIIIENNISEEEKEKLKKKYGENLYISYKVSDRILGNVSYISNKEVIFNTKDEWKLQCGGLTQHQFIIIKVNQENLPKPYKCMGDRLILARIIDPTPSPVEKDHLLHMFQLNKIQNDENIDSYTIEALTYGSIKGNILGTFYDENNCLKFGNDIENILSPINYSVYVPYDEDLEVLLNSFVKENEYKIGTLKYSETKPILKENFNIPVNVNIRDFIGENNNGQRTGLFSQTRSGKSNTIKILVDGILNYAIKNPDLKIGQLIIDPSGEYTYYNEQDNGSLFIKHHKNSSRYTLNTNTDLSEEEKNLHLEKAKQLRFNFYKNSYEGYKIIKELCNDNQVYMKEILNIDIPPEPISYNNYNRDEYNNYHKTISLWKTLLFKAGFDIPQYEYKIQIPIYKAVRQKLCLLLQDNWLDIVNEIENMIRAFNNESIDSSKKSIIEFIDENAKDMPRYLINKLNEFKGNIAKNSFDKDKTEEVFKQIYEDCNKKLLDEFNKKYSNTPSSIFNSHNILVDIKESQRIYKLIYRIFIEQPNIFGSKKQNYYSQEQEAILKAISEQGFYKVAVTRFREFRGYHTSDDTKDIMNEVVSKVINGETVFIDTSRGNETIIKYYSEKLAECILQKRMSQFSDGNISNSFVILYFEEAHILFPKDDKDLSNIYNKMAKEGSKYNISMCYSTQSITSISPDLLKNTNNFIISHLDDDREIKELQRKRKLRDIAEKVEQFSSKGYSLLSTESYEFSIPVQIDKFKL